MYNGVSPMTMWTNFIHMCAPQYSKRTAKLCVWGGVWQKEDEKVARGLLHD